MSFHAPEELRIAGGALRTTAADGNNGAFMFPGPVGRDLWIIASDGEGWEHVSVSLVGRVDREPTWLEMCAVKDLFWDREDAVVQIHPRASDYVNFHEGCLHLWRPTRVTLPLPPSILVGPKIPR